MTGDYQTIGIVNFKKIKSADSKSAQGQNWLHFVARLTTQWSTKANCEQLLRYLQGALDRSYKNLTASALTQTNMVMQSPLTLSLSYTPLLQLLMSQLGPIQLLEASTGLFKNGSPRNLHFLSLVTNEAIIDSVLAKITNHNLLVVDSLGNCLLHYAAFYRNMNLVERLLAHIKQSINISNKEGYTPLHIAVSSQKSSFELPKLEELIIRKDKSLLYSVNKQGYGPLHQAIVSSQLYQTDPINLVNMFLSIDKKLATSFGQSTQTPLHLIAQCKYAPLSALTLLKYSNDKSQILNKQGNTPLSEALLAHNINIALLFLQQSNEVQQNAQQYQPLIDFYQQRVSNRGNSWLHIEQFLSQEVIDAQTKEKIQKSNEEHKIGLVNTYELSLQQNFFGLYHLTNQNNEESQLKMLEGALLTSNFTLFKQLAANCNDILLSSISYLSSIYTGSSKQLQKANAENNRNLLHILASCSAKHISNAPDAKKKDDEDEDDYGDEEEDNDKQSKQDNTDLKDTYNFLVREQNMGLATLDYNNQNPLHLAIENKNLQFVDLVIEDMKNLSPQQITAILMAKDNVHHVNPPSLLIMKKTKISNKNQLKYLKAFSTLLKHKFTQAFQFEALNQKQLQQRQKQQLSLYSSTYLQPIILDSKLVQHWVSTLYDLIEQKNYKAIKFLMNKEVPFNLTMNSKQISIHPILFAALASDLKLVEIFSRHSDYVNIQCTSAQQFKWLIQPPYFGMDVTNSSMGILSYIISFNPQIRKQLVKQEAQTIDNSKNQALQNLFGRPIWFNKPQPSGLKEYERRKKQIEEDFNASIKQFESNKLERQNKSRQQDEDEDENLIDEDSKMTQTHKLVIYDSDDLPLNQMSIVLMKSDVNKGMHGTLRFYVMQLLQEKRNNHFILWTRWGRLGETGQFQRTPFASDKDGAFKEFKKIFRSKTGLAWENRMESNVKNKYRIITIGKQDKKQQTRTKFSSITQSISIQQIVKTLEEDELDNNAETGDEISSKSIKSIVKAAIVEILKKHLVEGRQDENFTNKKLLNASVTEENVGKAYQILQKALKLHGKANSFRKKQDHEGLQEVYEQIIELSNEYYCLIPTKNFSYAAVTPLDSSYQVQSQLEELQEVFNFGQAFKLAVAAISLNQRSKKIAIRAANESPLQYCISMLPLKMSYLKLEEDNEFKLIMQYINNGLGKDKDSKDFLVKNILKVSEEILHSDEDNRVYSNLHNHWLLWHGTPNENIMGILLKGLQVKPPNVQLTGSLFGEGVYFSDQFSKSREYASTDGHTFFMLLCEVALGNVANYSADWATERPQLGSHSVRTMSAEGPNFAQSVVLQESGVTVPLGENIKYPPPKVEQGDVSFKSPKNFAEYLDKQKKAAKKPKRKNKNKKGQDGSDEDMSAEESGNVSEDDDSVEEGSLANLGERQLEALEKSFLNVKNRRFEVKPHVITVDKHSQNRIADDFQNQNMDNYQGSDAAQYVVYCAKQVRVRYIVQCQKKSHS